MFPGAADLVEVSGATPSAINYLCHRNFMAPSYLLAITSALMKHRDPEVREQAALITGSFSLHQRAAPHMIEYSFKNLNDILEDSDQSVRDAAAWVFKMLSINATGLECIRDTVSANQMIARPPTLCTPTTNTNSSPNARSMMAALQGLPPRERQSI